MYLQKMSEQEREKEKNYDYDDEIRVKKKTAKISSEIVGTCSGQKIQKSIRLNCASNVNVVVHKCDFPNCCS